ncbi:MAG: hypothetical protein QG657_3541 [Acidobacteriota bacterium]|nr:hypothetical protein [Acidobacteriota bacterium]
MVQDFNVRGFFFEKKFLATWCFGSQVFENPPVMPCTGLQTHAPRLQTLAHGYNHRAHGYI